MEDERLTETLEFSITKQAKSDLQRAADARGVSMAELVRTGVEIVIFDTLLAAGSLDDAS